MLNVSLLDLTVSFGQIGIFALGGGDSMLKLIETECVVHRHWLTADDYGSLMAMTFLFPGLTAAKIAGMIGYGVAGVAGLLTAVLALNLPGIVLVAAGFTIMTKYMDRLAWRGRIPRKPSHGAMVTTELSDKSRNSAISVARNPLARRIRQVRCAASPQVFAATRR